MTEKNNKEEKTVEDNELLSYLQWEISRKTTHIRSFENRLLAALSIDSVIVGILATFYSLNPTIKLYERILFICFGVLLFVMLVMQLVLWWPRKASEIKGKTGLKDRINLADLNKQLNKIDETLYWRARVVYSGLVFFAIQIILLLVIIFLRII